MGVSPQLLLPMVTAARLVRRLLMAVLLSVAIGVGPVAVPASAEPTPTPTTSEPTDTSEPSPPTPEPPGTPEPSPPTVSEPPPAEASLTLGPDHGSIGDPIDVRGTGFDGCPAGTVYLHVVDGPEIASGIPVEEGGDFSYTEVIPADSEPDTYTFRAECTDDPSLYADADLVVESPGEPLLTLAEETGATGTAVQAEGTGFRCSNVDLLWDGDGPPLATAPVTEQATFATEIPVPSDAEPGAHSVWAVCQEYPEQYDEASYEVTGEPGTNPNQTDPNQTDPNQTDPNQTDPNQTDPNQTVPPGTAGRSTPVGWVVGPASLGGALALAAAAAVYFGRLHRGPRWVRNHVRAALRPAVGATALIDDRASGEPPSHSTRLDPHPDPGRQTLEEDR